ncbi:MAG: 30S ribosomal protein S6 [Bacteroidetes bacterium GWF2_43_63]|nr:MAG: 30S ribosomal protein S6 [Bacteroidetes bacterium GWE2_42_42]OFY54882.1 MAG: 30S ribosomal protein S6 [Bacteroidetes bacterium GWF2_43_63]HCB63211.1 30S ribosomal protein S6 [Bacteroidales bacterium]HCY22184.1 30S ribosomal protein S6 [Bacteroidales bacterium]
MVRRYETVFIMTPVLSDEQAKETVQKFRKLLTDKGAQIRHEEDWGLKKLAYPIQKKTTGFYRLIEFEAEGTVVSELEVNYKRDERVIRFLTVSLDKYGVEFVEKRRRLKADKAKEEGKKEPEV